MWNCTQQRIGPKMMRWRTSLSLLLPIWNSFMSKLKKDFRRLAIGYIQTQASFLSKWATCRYNLTNVKVTSKDSLTLWISSKLQRTGTTNFWRSCFTKLRILSYWKLMRNHIKTTAKRSQTDWLISTKIIRRIIFITSRLRIILKSIILWRCKNRSVKICWPFSRISLRWYRSIIYMRRPS